MNAVEEMPRTNLAIAPVTPMDLIQRAAAQGASIEQMQQLFELKLRVEADEAQKAYNVAFSAFKSEAVRVVKNVTVKDGPLKDQKYADLFGVVTAVVPALAKHGLSHSWKLTRDEKDWMEVTCTIRHSLGHSESVSMGASPDTGPGRNAIQARGSAKSYLERYTLLAATGLAASGVDTDGNTPPAKPLMADTDFVGFCDNIENAETKAELDRFYSIAVKAAEEAKDGGSVRQFTLAKDKRAMKLATTKEELHTVYSAAYAAARAAKDQQAMDQLLSAKDARKASFA